MLLNTMVTNGVLQIFQLKLSQQHTLLSHYGKTHNLKVVYQVYKNNHISNSHYYIPLTHPLSTTKLKASHVACSRVLGYFHAIPMDIFSLPFSCIHVTYHHLFIQPLIQSSNQDSSFYGEVKGPPNL